MSLHSKEIDRIARVLARHLFEFDQRQRLASKAEVAAQAQIAGEVVEAWRDIVHCSQVNGTLEVLLRAALAERPQERELRKLVELLDGEPEAPLARYLWVAGSLVVAGVAALLWSGGLSEEEEGRLEAPGVGVATQATESSEAPMERSGPPVGPPAHASSVAAPELSAERAVELAEDLSGPLPQEEAPEVASVASDSETISGRCGGVRGELVGYFYANEGISAEVGRPYTMKRDVNVRTDFPRKENQWSATQSVACVLQRSDVVVLSSPPFEVDGAKVWVPLHVGDLQP